MSKATERRGRKWLLEGLTAGIMVCGAKADTIDEDVKMPEYMSSDRLLAAGVLEMADRTHCGDWSRDLSMADVLIGKQGP